MCYNNAMNRFVVFGAILLFASPSFAWNNTCYKEGLPEMPFPKESRSTITLEARRVVSVEGNLITYDLGKEKVVIKADGVISQSFLKEVQKGHCTVKGFVSVEPDKSSFSNTVRFKAGTPGPR